MCSALVFICAQEIQNRDTKGFGKGNKSDGKNSFKGHGKGKDKGKGKGVWCFSCGQQGHTAKHCTNNKGTGVVCFTMHVLCAPLLSMCRNQKTCGASGQSSCQEAGHMAEH